MLYQEKKKKKNKKTKISQGTFPAIPTNDTTIRVYCTYGSKNTFWVKRTSSRGEQIWYNETKYYYEELDLGARAPSTEAHILALIQNTDTHLDHILNGFEFICFQYHPDGRAHLHSA